MLLVFWYLLGEHTAGQHILCLDGHQVCFRDSSPFGKEAVGLAKPCPVYGIAHAAGVGEAGHVHTPLEVGSKRMERLWAETIHLLCKHELRDSKQLIERVIGEIQVMRDARTDARVGLQ